MALAADRAEAHAGNVDDRGRVGLRAGRPADGDAEIGVLDLVRADRMADPAVARLVDVDDRAERVARVDVLGAAVGDVALFAAEGQGVAVVLDQVLPDRRADFLEQVAQVPDDRIVAQDRVRRLRSMSNTPSAVSGTSSSKRPIETAASLGARRREQAMVERDQRRRTERTARREASFPPGSRLFSAGDQSLAPACPSRRLAVGRVSRSRLRRENEGFPAGQAARRQGHYPRHETRSNAAPAVPLLR